MRYSVDSDSVCGSQLDRLALLLISSASLSIRCVKGELSQGLTILLILLRTMLVVDEPFVSTLDVTTINKQTTCTLAAPWKYARYVDCPRTAVTTTYAIALYNLDEALVKKRLENVHESGRKLGLGGQTQQTSDRIVCLYPSDLSHDEGIREHDGDDDVGCEVGASLIDEHGEHGEQRGMRLESK